MAAHALSSASEFVERCHSVSDTNTVIADFRSLIAGYGFSASVCGAWDGFGQQRVNRFFFSDWPESWLKLYAEKDFFSADPFVEEARRAMTPFLWSEVEFERPLTPRGKEIYAIGRDYGWREVVGIPIHGPAGYQGMVSLASMKDITLSAIDRGILDMTSRVIHERCRKEIGFGVMAQDTPKLTARELECMQWVAVGKTDWEIAQVLGISSSTAHFHVESAKKKLGLNSRAEAVARLTLYGLL
jgi:LuxR family quorum sensing-dependent transcriptional regulator